MATTTAKKNEILVKEKEYDTVKSEAHDEAKGAVKSLISTFSSAQAEVMSAKATGDAAKQAQATAALQETQRKFKEAQEAVKKYKSIKKMPPKIKFLIIFLSVFDILAGVGIWYFFFRK